MDSDDNAHVSGTPSQLVAAEENMIDYQKNLEKCTNSLANISILIRPSDPNMLGLHTFPIYLSTKLRASLTQHNKIQGAI